MNGCESYGPELGAYLDDELEANERSVLETHLPGCAPCQDALAEQRQLLLALADLPKLEPAPQFEARFWARLARANPSADGAGAPGWRSRWLWLQGGLATAAVVALALVLTNGSAELPEEDWEIVSDPERFELLASEDLAVLRELELLENWDGSEEI
jgi:anti-sigma factor RsiW